MLKRTVSLLLVVLAVIFVAGGCGGSAVDKMTPAELLQKAYDAESRENVTGSKVTFLLSGTKLGKMQIVVNGKSRKEPRAAYFLVNAEGFRANLDMEGLFYKEEGYVKAPYFAKVAGDKWVKISSPLNDPEWKVYADNLEEKINPGKFTSLERLADVEEKGQKLIVLKGVMPKNTFNELLPLENIEFLENEEFPFLIRLTKEPVRIYDAKMEGQFVVGNPGGQGSITVSLLLNLANDFDAGKTPLKELSEAEKRSAVSIEQVEAQMKAGSKN